MKQLKNRFGSKKFYTDMEVVPNMEKPLVLYCDNSGAVENYKEPRSHKRGKHIERKYHLIQEIIHRGDVAVMKIVSKQNLADPFTKTLPERVFMGSLRGTRFKRHVSLALGQVGDCWPWRPKSM